MAQLIDLEGLPDPVAKAIAETVLNLKNSCKPRNDESSTRGAGKPLKELPARPGRVIGSLRRVDLYEDR